MYGDVLDNVNWGRGASGTYFHKVCRLHVADEWTLNRVVARQNSDKSVQNTKNTEDVLCTS